MYRPSAFSFPVPWRIERRLSFCLFGILVSLLSGFGLSAVAWATPIATPITLTVTSAGSAVASGSVVTLTAAVLAGGSAVTPGQVKFCDATAAYCTDVHVLGTAQLTSAGTATLRFVPGIGSHSYKAVFVGTTSDAGSASAAAALTVTTTGTYGTTTTIAQAGSAGNYTLTGTVMGFGTSTVAPTGIVSFLDTNHSNSVLGTAGLGAAVVGLAFAVPAVPITFSSPAAVAPGDFNGDGKLDIAVANYNGATVAILLGNGDGTFRAATNVATTLNPSSILVADFNGDGRADLAVGDFFAGELDIFLGNGDGTFTKKTGISNGVLALLVGDFNADGIPDLVQGNGFLPGFGDGTFGTPVQFPAGISPSAAFVAGDFNGTESWIWQRPTRTPRERQFCWA